MTTVVIIIMASILSAGAIKVSTDSQEEKNKYEQNQEFISTPF